MSTNKIIAACAILLLPLAFLVGVFIESVYEDDFHVRYLTLNGVKYELPVDAVERNNFLRDRYGYGIADYVVRTIYGSDIARGLSNNSNLIRGSFDGDLEGIYASIYSSVRIDRDDWNHGIARYIDNNRQLLEAYNSPDSLSKFQEQLSSYELGTSPIGFNFILVDDTVFLRIGDIGVPTIFTLRDFEFMFGMLEFNN